MKPAVTYPDAERQLVDLATTLLADEPVTVGVGLPPNAPADGIAHVELAWDGTPTHAHPVVIFPTIRIVVHSFSTTEAKRLASLAWGLLCAEPGISPLTGVLPASDPVRPEVQLASCTVRAVIRSIPIEPTGS